MFSSLFQPKNKLSHLDSKVPFYPPIQGMAYVGLDGQKS
jgi:hypothetical protein